MRVRNNPGVLGPILLALFTGCSSYVVEPEHPIPGPPEYLPRTSPVHLLENLKQACREQNYDRYAELFAPSFVFERWPAEVNPDLPRSWPLADELTAIQRMFRDETVEGIFLRLTPTTCTPAREGDHAPPASWKMHLELVHLEVDRRLENGELMTLLADHDRALFFFIETDEMTSDHQRIWKINLWRGQPIWSLAPSSS